MGWGDAHLLVAAAPLCSGVGVSLLSVLGAQGVEARFTVAVNHTPPLVAPVVLNFARREKERVLRVGRKVRPTAGRAWFGSL